MNRQELRAATRGLKYVELDQNGNRVGGTYTVKKTSAVGKTNEIATMLVSEKVDALMAAAKARELEPDYTPPKLKMTVLAARYAILVQYGTGLNRRFPMS